MEMLIQILVDNVNSWILPYSIKLKCEIEKRNIICKIIHSHSEIEAGDILILLSCEKILKNLSNNKFNIVVHESDLPNGKGWSPLTWQILEGKSLIPITVFEASTQVDSGLVYLRSQISFEGHELLNEMREVLGNKIIELLLELIESYPNLVGSEQSGEATYYKRRKELDSELDINQSINEQFNLLRVVDNDRYPAFFYKNGFKYYIKVYK